jgi:hypothetical protein
MSGELGTQIDDENLNNFIALDHTIVRRGDHCIILAWTGASRLTVLALLWIALSVAASGNENGLQERHLFLERMAASETAAVE